MARKRAKSEEPKKKKPISLNILEIAKRLQKLEQTSGGGDHSSLANKSDIATEFNTTTVYTAGCFVYHDGKLYQFNADHAAGAWDSTDVVEANVTDQVVSNKSAIEGLTASDVTYGNQSVKDALDRLTADTFGAAVDLASYTTYANAYTCPSDGYVWIGARTTDGGKARATINDAISISAIRIGLESGFNALFVRGGTKVHVEIGSSDYAYFRPLR